MNHVVTNASILVHIAAMFYVAGFLVRDQLLLRGLVLTGTLCYLGYYNFALEKPLWDAIFWSSILGMANLFIIVKMVRERYAFNMSEEEKQIYKVFDAMLPGEFRRLLKISTWQNGDGSTLLTQEGEPVEHLYYVLDGDISVEKSGQNFNIRHGTFIGEVAFFLNSNASATVCVGKGGRYLKWRKQELLKLQKSYPGIRVALYSILNDDMAKKVAQSMGKSAVA
jgi:hypothetical protein